MTTHDITTTERDYTGTTGSDDLPGRSTESALPESSIANADQISSVPESTYVAPTTRSESTTATASDDLSGHSTESNPLEASTASTNQMSNVPQSTNVVEVPRSNLVSASSDPSTEENFPNSTTTSTANAPGKTGVIGENIMGGMGMGGSSVERPKEDQGIGEKIAAFLGA